MFQLWYNLSCTIIAYFTKAFFKASSFFCCGCYQFPGFRELVVCFTAYFCCVFTGCCMPVACGICCPCFTECVYMWWLWLGTANHSQNKTYNKYSIYKFYNTFHLLNLSPFFLVIFLNQYHANNQDIYMFHLPVYKILILTSKLERHKFYIFP